MQEGRAVDLQGNSRVLDMAYFTEPMGEEFRKALEEAMKEFEEKPKKRLSKKNKQEMK